MNFLKKQQLTIQKQLIIATITAIVACAIKTITYVLFYDNKTGLFQRNSFVGISDVVFYILLAIIIVLSFTMTVSSTPFYKKITKKPPLIIGYALFFTAVMFVVQGLIGFYTHFTQLIEMKTRLISMDFWEFVPVVIPFLADIFCTMCAFSFYKMAMECFSEDDAPVRGIKSSIIPCAWGILTLLQIFLLTVNKLYVQNYYEQLFIGILNVTFLYYIVKQFYTVTPIQKKSVFSIFIEVCFALTSVALIFPYLILLLFGIKDTIPAMPYFAMFGISIYGIVLTLNYLLTASIFQGAKTKDK